MTSYSCSVPVCLCACVPVCLCRSSLKSQSEDEILDGDHEDIRTPQDFADRFDPIFELGTDEQRGMGSLC